jgi:excisionase family DNA binding protein
MKKILRPQRPPAADSELVFTVNEVAAKLRSSHFFVRDEMDRRRLAFLRFGRRYYVRESDLTAYLMRVRTPAFGEKGAQ